MTPRSLAWRTDLAVLQQSGSTVEDRGDHLVVRTPDNPSFHWGNFLLLREAPAAHAGADWLARFTAAFPDASHVAIGVDLPHGGATDLAPIVDAGLEADVAVVLTRPCVADPAADPAAAGAEVEVRPLDGDADWDQRVALSLARYPREGDDNATFVRRRAAAERRRVEAGHGAWWGAFEAGRLLSACGIFVVDHEVARYQDVETHPDAERRGLASAVLAAAGAYAATRGVTTLAIVADPDDGAVRLYRRLGFVDTETQVSAYRTGADPAP